MVYASNAASRSCRTVTCRCVAGGQLDSSAFIAVRAEGEALIRASGMKATFVRPWYVLGPGHRWPYALLPFYWIAELLPATRESARRLGLITIAQILKALVWAVENPPADTRILDVPRIRELS